MFILSTIAGLVVNLLILYAVIRFILSMRRKALSSAGRLFISKEDAAGQFFILLSVALFGVMLLVVNSNIGSPLSWKTVILITTGAGFAAAYRLKMILILPFALIGLQYWIGASIAGWIEEAKAAPYAVFLGLLFINILSYLTGRIHEKEPGFKRASFVYTVTGLIFVTVSLFWFSMGAGLDFLQEMTQGDIVTSSWKASLAVTLLAAAVIGALYYADKKRLIHPYEAYAVLIILALFGVLALVYQPSIFEGWTRYNRSGENLSFRGIYLAVVINVLAFAELLGLIFLGYYRRQEGLVNVGALLLFIFIFVKYVDWFFKFMDKYLFFMGAGALLFAVGWFMEKGRRRVISDIKKA